MEEPQSQLIELNNGIQLLCEQSIGNAELFGITINAGSRDEKPEHYGLAHFVEHTIFKGTTHRRAHHIINRMEAVGGELNAFTTKEDTCVYTLFPKGYLYRGAELIVDLVSNSVFPNSELIMEKEVVRDEINSYLDNPSEAIFDDFEELFYANTPLSHNILGTEATLQTFDSSTCCQYLKTHFTAERMTAFYRGNLTPERAAKMITPLLESIEIGAQPMQREQIINAPQFSVSRNLNLHQSHTVMGCAIPGIKSTDRIAIGLLTNILGGPGMNSRLNVSLREKRGLVYSVDASANFLSDCGLLNIYFGCDRHDTSRCLELAEHELKKLSTQPLSPRTLATAKRQYLGQLQIATDNNEQMALSGARTAAYFHRVPSQSETISKIEAISPEHLLEIASTYLKPENFSRLTFY